ncbi:J domain-containing protein [Sphingomicrobium astaxanthinifaciens]|uniref:J domain-containing protein n=1 Tax=Sphingomicrobium astaxanthinifaciens TaxID=1227949 RepID=UPI001FCBDD23|nr:J domain-containing protein [Sphingomicrobium astaxanthinifaciens]MCJ7420268.1 J domain-containing protein [Sphingomicrobium astaxanthinifaciens]
MKQSHYALLGVAEDAALADIRRAYHAKMRANHPDVAAAGNDHVRPDDAYRLNAAYSVLSDPAKRKAYDRELASERHSSRVVVANTGGRRHQRHNGPVNTAERFGGQPPRIVWLVLLAIFLNLVLLTGIYLQGGFD